MAKIEEFDWPVSLEEPTPRVRVVRSIRPDTRDFTDYSQRILSPNSRATPSLTKHVNEISSGIVGRQNEF